MGIHAGWRFILSVNRALNPDGRAAAFGKFVEFLINSAALNEFLVPSGFDDASLVENDD